MNKNRPLPIYCFVFLFFFTASFVQAQSFDWVYNIPGLDASNNLSLTTDMEKDAAGNIYIAGQINGQSIWETDTISSNEILSDIFLPAGFIARFDPEGSLHWVETFLTSGAGMAKVSEMEVDDTGNIYLLIDFSVDIEIGGMVFEAPFNGNNGVAIVKLNTDLEVEWANVNEPQFIPDGILMKDVKLGENNALFVSGIMSGTVDFWGVTLDVFGIGPSFYILRLDATDGTVIWGNAFGHNAELSSGGKMSIDANNNIYFTAGQFGVADYEGNFLGSEEVTTIILSRWDEDGALQWVTGSQTNSNFELGNSVQDVMIATDGVYITGGFAASSLDFGNGVVLNRDLSGSTDFYVVKFNTQGNAIWARQTHSLSQSVLGREIAVTSDDGLIIGGRYSGNGQDLVFQNGNNSVTTSSTANNELFFVKYAGNGDLLWFKQTAGFGEKTIPGMVLTGSNSVAFTGYYTNELILGGTILIPTPTFSSRNLYVGHCAGNLTNIQRPEDNIAWEIFPNPAHGQLQLNMEIPEKENPQFQLKDLLGRQILKQNINNTNTTVSLTGIPTGIYLATLQGTDFYVSKQVVID